jgi:thiol:disulfide interchange protein DsbA
MKTSRLALLLCTVLAMAACKPDASDAAPAAADATPATATATAQQASAEDASVQAAAEAAMQAAEAAAAQSPPPVAGTDYVEIPGGQPFATTDGRIEVAEIFGYTCGHCAAVQPTVRAMKAKLPPDVNMVYIPAAFGGAWDTYAKAYYAAEAMGLLDKTHDAMFRAIHIDRSLKGMAGNDSPEQVAAFYAAYGADPGQFVSSMQSFAVATKLNRARQFIEGAFANGDTPATPTFLVNGKYRVKARSVDDMFRVLNQLIVAERASKPAAPAAADAPAAPAQS